MALNLNQQGITPKAGEGVYAPFPARTFKLSPTYTGANNNVVGATTACKLSGESTIDSLPIVTPITAATDKVYCVVAYDLRDGGNIRPNQPFKGWVSDEVVWLVSSAAIPAASNIEFGLDGRVAVADTGSVSGIAESTATAAGQFVAVRLTCPYTVE